MKTVLVAIVAGVVAAPAMAEDHTVSWFQTHPREMDAQIAACADDPGHAKYVPNCENASQAQLTRAAIDAQAHLTAMMAESDIQRAQDWRQHPQVLLERLKLCNTASVSATVRAVWHCSQAFSVAQQITGHP